MMMVVKKIPGTIPAAVLTSILCLPVTAPAQSGTWTNLASGQSWSVSGNWNGGTVADGAGNTANFNTLDIIADTTVRVDTVRTIGNIIFGDTATNTAAGWIMDNNGSAANILTLAGTTPTITVNAMGTNKSAIISGVIAGTSGLAKAGPGMLILSGANTYSGGTVINGGTLFISSDGNLGNTSGFVTLNNSILQVGATISLSGTRGITVGPGTNTFVKPTGNKTITYNGVISGSGIVNFGDETPSGGDGGGGGRHWLYAANTYTNDTIITFLGAKDPGIVLYNSLALQNTTLDFNTVNIPSAMSGSMVIFSVANPVLGGLKGNRGLDLSYQNNNPGTVKIGNNNQDTTFSGNLSSTALTGLTKIGSGTLTLTGNNTFTGTNTVESGTLKVATINNVSVAGPLGQSALAVVMGKAGGSTGTLEYTSVTTTSTKPFKMATGGTGSFQIDNAGTTLTLSGLIDGAGSLAKTGPGTLILAGANTYTGDTKVNAGTLSITNAWLCDTSAVYIATNAILDLNFTGTDTIGYLFLGGHAITPGIYGNFASADEFIDGNGTLTVQFGPPPAGMVVIIR